MKSPETIGFLTISGDFLIGSYLIRLNSLIRNGIWILKQVSKFFEAFKQQRKEKRN